MIAVPAGRSWYRWWKARVLEWPPERPSKQTGRLARENTARSPPHLRDGAAP